jgi:DNA recombination protein RmuC
MRRNQRAAEPERWATRRTVAVDTFSFPILVIVAGVVVALFVLVLLVLTKRPQDVANVIPPIQNLTQEIGRLQADLRGLQERVVARQHLDQQNADALRRLETIIAGTQTKGLAGENVIDLVFSQLPPEWQVRNFQIGNKVVEFALRLPNKLVLPIDSKWPATDLLEQFISSPEVSRQLELKEQIEKAILSRVREVRKYIHPDVTVDFAVAAVPDAAFDLCSSIQVEALRMNVVLIAYSMIVPYLLLAFQTILRSSQDIDIQRISAYLASADKSLTALQGEIEGRFSKGLTMLANSRDEMRLLLATIKTGLTSVQALAPPENEAEQLGGDAGIERPT